MMRTATAALMALLLASPAPAQEDGKADLDKATEVQLSARTLRDLERVADLCEKALKAGLNEDDQEFARQLLSSSMLQHGERVAKVALDDQSNPRWQLMRHVAMRSLERAIEYSPKLGEAHLLVAQLQVLPGGDLDRARKAADAAVKSFPDNKRSRAQALLLRARLQEDAEKRLADIQQVIELDPNDTDAYQALAGHYLSEEKPEKTLEAFRKVIELDPENVTAKLALAETLASMDRQDEADAEIEKVIKDHPDAASAYMLRAQMLTTQEDYKGAIAALNQAVRLEPENFRALLFRAELRLVSDDLKGAREDADAVLRTNPGLVIGYLMRARVRAADDDAAGAAEDLELVISNSPEPETDWVLQLASYYSLDERPRKAIQLITEVVKEEPENWRALRQRGDALLSIGKHKEAIADYEAALKLTDEDSGLLNNLAWVLATSPKDDLRDGKRAIELATKACEMTDYKEAHILSTLASGYAEQGDFETARKWSAKAVELGEGEMKEQLQEELESYKKDEPWRELQEQKEKIVAPPGGLIET